MRAGQRCPRPARSCAPARARARACAQEAPQGAGAHAALCAQAEQRARPQQSAAARRGIQRRFWMRLALGSRVYREGSGATVTSMFSWPPGIECPCIADNAS